MAQIIRITSEALQATIRRLLPSQQGFGEDLQATNVITPIIDLTPTAEGSELPTNLQTALDLGGTTSFAVEATTANIITTTGFWRVYGVATHQVSNAVARGSQFEITDGTTTKAILPIDTIAGLVDEVVTYEYDFNIFVKAGETVSINCGTATRASGNVRQLADINGNLTNPVGFTPQ